MPKKLQKCLQDYLSKIKKPPPQISLPSTKWIRSGCKHPKTLSFAIDREPNEAQNDVDDAATLSDIDEFLFENFRSLYLRDGEDGNDEDEDEKRSKERHELRSAEAFWDKTPYLKEDRSSEVFWDNAPHLNEGRRTEIFCHKTPHLPKVRPSNHHVHENNHQNSGGVLFESPRFNVDPPAMDLCGSNRFFVTPGRLSSSVMEEARTSTTVTSEDGVGSSWMSSTPTLNDSTTQCSSSTIGGHDDDRVTLPNDCIAVLTYSPSPYDDFRSSMHEMVQARLRNEAKVDWNFMEELLFCYLNLNEKKSYRFILSAFADLVVDLRQINSDVRSSAPHRSTKFSNSRQKG